MISESFLSLLDDRVKPSGSRDPLGFQTVWVELGRTKLGIENLTTITSSIDNFIIALLACAYAFRENDKNKKMDIFFKVEQLGAYFRIAYRATHNNYETNIMGITKASEFYKSSSDILLGEEAQIFGEQKTSGLWGYYTSALVKSQLINSDKTSLEKKGMEIVQKFEKMFSNIDELVRNNNITKDKIEELSVSFVGSLNLVYADMSTYILDTSEYKIYSVYARSFFMEENIPSYEKFYDWLIINKPNDALTKTLQKIKKIDETLWVASKIFDFCRLGNNENIRDKVEAIRKSAMANSIGHLTSVDEVKEFVIAWNQEDYQKAILSLIEIHQKAMEKRNTSPWIKAEKDNTLNVLVPSKVKLPDKISNSIDWQYNYFLYSYMNIAYQVWNKGNDFE